MIKVREQSAFVSTRNACKLCAPLGACLALKGIEGAMPILHGSQGCATYVRRYIISHFKEPMDIASSSFGESSTIFGGGKGLFTALDNVIRQYGPSLIGVATTCLSETIGDDVPMMLNQYLDEHPQPLPIRIVPISTPSYKGTHMDGFHAAVHAVVAAMARDGRLLDQINILSGFISPSDIRYLKEILADFETPYVLLPDYSETLDGPTWREYELIPPGGTPLDYIESMGSSQATIEFGKTFGEAPTAGRFLRQQFKVPNYRLGLPIGIHETDKFFTVLENLTGRPTPTKYRQERGRLIDSYVDGHKYVFEKRAIVYGEEDFVIGLTAFLMEIGVTPVLCASGGRNGRLEEGIRSSIEDSRVPLLVREGAGFVEIEELARDLKPDLMIGSSKGNNLARRLGIPLVRAGFPIHDRIGGQRILHLGYRGGQELFDRIVNTLIEKKQNDSPVGYSYM